MQWKYNEEKILKDIEEYVVSTYHGHYCGDEDGYNDIQTIDLMAAKGLAAPSAKQIFSSMAAAMVTRMVLTSGIYSK